jgi:ribonuclease HII
MALKTRFKEDNLIEAGVDEAGRGCLWGPVYAGAVIWAPEDEWSDEHREIAPQIKDSKKLTAKKRQHVNKVIQSLAIDYGVGSVSAKEIDESGMTFANRLAFQRAIAALTVVPARILVDGTLPLRSEQLTELGVDEQETIVDGDASYLPIAAASIIAKEAHDEVVQKWIVDEPSLQTNYGLASGKGYGTKKHRDGILEHGKHSEHRNLFLRKLLGTVVNVSNTFVTPSQQTQTWRLQEQLNSGCLITDD